MILITIIFLKNLPYQALLTLCLNAFRLVVLLISSGTLFHNAGTMKDKGCWPVLILGKGCWRF